MPKNSAPVGETKAQAFSRIAGLRTYNALEAVRKLEALANVNAYEYTPQQIAKIINALHDAVHKVEDTFEGKVNKPQKTFIV